MGAQKLTEVVIGSTPTEDTHFLITQPETVEGSKVEAVRRATTGNIKELMANGLIAPKFSDQSTYTAGSYVLKNGVLYKFTAAHTGAWTGSDAETVTVGKELTDLKADLQNLETTEIYVQDTSLVINTNLVNGNEVSY